MARALLGREIDAEVSVALPEGRVELVVLEIAYP
jgi:transcription elongation GreA/GreB family factor